MTTVKVTKTYTGINGETYEKGKTYQLRTKEAIEILESGNAERLDPKGR